MAIKSLGLKVSLLVAFIITFIVVGCFVYLSASFDTLIIDLTANEARSANVTLSKALEEYQNEAYNRARVIADEPDVTNLIQENDMAALKHVLEMNMFGLDFITLCDINGDVLARGH
ncbi:MAG: hypothetical protein LBH09_03145, partial [Peptococcaceae bacterium]|nr:hypothetical protein [Peptococcaceae bacterium]